MWTVDNVYVSVCVCESVFLKYKFLIYSSFHISFCTCTCRISFCKFIEIVPAFVFVCARVCDCLLSVCKWIQAKWLMEWNVEQRNAMISSPNDSKKSRVGFQCTKINHQEWKMVICFHWNVSIVLIQMMFFPVYLKKVKRTLMLYNQRNSNNNIN